MIKKEKPLGIKVIATYYIIASTLTFLFGLFLAIFANSTNIITKLIPEAILLDSGALRLFGLVFVIFGIIVFFVGLALFNLKSWARYIIIFFTLLGFFMSLTGLFTGQLSNLVGLFINGFISWYLIFNKKAKEAFR